MVYKKKSTGSAKVVTEVKSDALKAVIKVESNVSEEILKVKKKKDFRIRAKGLFCTYPQLKTLLDDESLKASALAQFRQIFVKQQDTMQYLFSVEAHEDGSPHLHCYLKFREAVGVYSQRRLGLLFPVNEIDSEEEYSDAPARQYFKFFGGKYEAAKNSSAIVGYILKDVDDRSSVFSNMNLPVFNNLHYGNMLEHLHAVLTEEGLAASIRTYYDVYPIDCLRKGGTVVNNLTLANVYYQSEKRRKNIVVRDMGEFVNVPDVVSDWVRGEEVVSLVIHGHPGTGKTQLAMAAMTERLNSPKFIMISNKNQLGELAKSPDGTGLIFDDMGMDDLGREALIHLTDIEQDRAIRVLYGVADIPKHTLKIFTLNRLDALTRGDRAIERRVRVVELTKSVIPGRVVNTSIADKRLHSFYEVPEPVPVPVPVISNSNKGADASALKNPVSVPVVVELALTKDK
jgi:hypothetical protein